MSPRPPRWRECCRHLRAITPSAAPPTRSAGAAMSSVECSTSNSSMRPVTRRRWLIPSSPGYTAPPSNSTPHTSPRWCAGRCCRGMAKQPIRPVTRSLLLSTPACRERRTTPCGTAFSNSPGAVATGDRSGRSSSMTTSSKRRWWTGLSKYARRWNSMRPAAWSSRSSLPLTKITIAPSRSDATGRA